MSPDPYRVTFFEPGGPPTVGPVLKWEPVPVSNAHKQEWREERQRPRPAIVYDGTSNTYTYRQGTYREPEEWPRYLPPFLPEAVMFAPDGMLWVKRTTAADAPPRFDVIDRRGQIALRVVLPKRTLLAGFGAGTVYLARLDDEEMQYLERYRAP